MKAHLKSSKKKKKAAYKAWKNSMKAIYPNFEPKKWGSTSYRIKHPQLAPMS